MRLTGSSEQMTRLAALSGRTRRWTVAQTETALFLGLALLQNNGGSSITKQYGNVAVAPVHVGGYGLDADDQGIGHDAGANHGRGCGQAI